MAFGKKAPAGKSKSKFQYKKASADAYRARASQQGGSFDSPVLDSIKVFNPKTGDHDIRIMPPTWEDASSFGLEVYMHYRIGADGGTYICLHKMKGEECPICIERTKAERAGEDELADALKPGKRVAMWVIDRSAEKEGPKLWLAPWTLERDMCTLAIDKKTNEVFQLDDPEEGYDVSFTVQGEKLTKKYVGVQIARRASPLHDDEDKAQEWLDYIVEHPIPDCLVYREPEYLEEVLGSGTPASDGGVKGKDKGKKQDDGGEDDAPKGRPKLGKRKQEEPEEPEEPSDEAELPTWEEVHEMDEDTLLELCESCDIEPGECPDDEEPADWVCEQLGIEKPKPKKEEGKPSFKSKLANLRKGGK